MIDKYPALLLLLVLVGGLVAKDRGAPFFLAVGVGALLFWGTCFVYTLKERAFLSFQVIFLCGIFLGALSFCLYRFETLPRRISLSETLSGKARVLEERPWGGLWVHIVGTPQGKFLYRTFAREALKEGDSFLYDASLVPLENHSHKGMSLSSFDEKKYWGARGVFHELKVGHRKKVFSEGWNIHSWRGKMVESVLLRFPPLTRGYLLALWVGKKDPFLAGIHRKWGTAHLLAVSGFHVGLVLFLVLFLFPSFMGRFRYGFASLLMWSYIFLAGASPSALRAGLVGQILLLGSFRGYGGNGVNAVALGASMLLLWRPWWFWDLGWELSVLAALGVALLASISKKGVLWWGSPAIWCLTAFPLIKAFGAVPLGGIVLNYIAIPGFSLLFPLTALVGLFGLFHLPGSLALLGLNEKVLTGWHVLIDQGARLMDFHISSSSLAFTSGSLVMAVLLVHVFDFSPGKRLLTFMVTWMGIFALYYGVM